MKDFFKREFNSKMTDILVLPAIVLMLLSGFVFEHNMIAMIITFCIGIGLVAFSVVYGFVKSSTVKNQDDENNVE